MPNLYYPGITPTEYDMTYLKEELEKIALVFSGLELPTITLIPQHVALTRPQEGMIVNADGTDWNPGSGAGLYEYVGGAWSKL